MAIDPRQKELWLRELHLNGFLILRNFLPVDLVTSMHDQLNPILLGEYNKAQRDGFKRGRASGRLALDVEVYINLLGGPLADDAYLKNPIIEELVEAILGGPDSWKRGWTQVEAVWRGSQDMVWHSDQDPQDTPDMDAPHETLRVTYNIPLVDFTSSNGAMEIIPGSHRLPRSFANTMSLHDLPNIYSVQLQLRRGDALLRDGNTLHSGTANLTDDVRPMLDQTYKRA